MPNLVDYGIERILPSGPQMLHDLDTTSGQWRCGLWDVILPSNQCKTKSELGESEKHPKPESRQYLQSGTLSRYKKFREFLHFCKLPWGAERDHGGIALPVLPEDHRAKEKSPRTFVKEHEHEHYGSAVDPWLRGLPTEQYYDVTQLKKSDACMNDELIMKTFKVVSKPTSMQSGHSHVAQSSWVVLFYYLTHPQENSINCSGMMLGNSLVHCDLLVRVHKPPDSLAKPLRLPFPTSHCYTHFSRYAMFSNFRSPEDRETEINASSHQPFHPNIPNKAFDVIVLRRTGGNPYRHEVVNIPSDSQKPAVQWLGQHYFDIKKYVSLHRERAKRALPEWIPGCEVPQHQTALLEL
ncbi:LOW QUALITY PROTEIN: sperm-associated microtubule inner protein 4 [Chlamydotis macqueenii]